MQRIVDAIFSFFRSPILWGLLGAAGFYALIFGGPFDIPLIRRYFTGHPVEYGETVLFAIGLAALVLKIFDIGAQYPGLRQSPLGPALRGAESSAEQCRLLLERLDKVSRRRDEYYVHRLRGVLERLDRRGSAEGLDDDMRYLADVDADRQHSSYGLFRVIIWAIPILGFLGTVVGITMALNGLDPKALDESMLHVTTGLGVKFDTTALALAMSMLLMFLHFFVDRADTAILARVDELVERELGDRFRRESKGPNGQLAAMRDMTEAVLKMTQRLLDRQTEMWQEGMESAASRWTNLVEATGARFEKALSGGLAQSLASHAQHLAAAEKTTADHAARQWEKVEHAHAQNVEHIAALRADTARQVELLQRALESMGDVTRLQDVLNRNLASLAGAKHIEQTVLGLAAAVHLLNARLAESQVATSIPLEAARPNVQAA
jgi:biopolymer transport protein ExbB/TolQ